MTAQQPIRTPGDSAVARRIGDAVPAGLLRVRGVVQATRSVTVGHGVSYSATLSDGTGNVDLLFLGRPTIRGVNVGTRCIVEGRAASRGGGLVVWNPRYWLIAAGAPDDSCAGTTQRTVPVPPSGTQPTPIGDEMRDDELVEAAGHFRVYLGAAAGVGKTCAMLDEAQRRRRRGRDVVVGFVESHGRPVTQAAMTGLEVIPRKIVEYRGARFEEMDLDAIIARRPEIVLVDELAHTNIPGASGNAKRWQDVGALLAADIDVITTVNIQHLESLADTVEQITGVPVRERVPDAVLRQADQIELVDSSPEQLRRRMLHGNIYPLDKVPQALSHFFRADNLTALRELTLRFLADETEDNLVEHLQQTDTRTLWETAERILVAVTPAPGTDVVMRRACRMAARVKADLHVAHVASGDVHDRRDIDDLTDLRILARDIGAEWTDLHGDHPAQALLEFAREHQITQIVIGPSQRTRWQELLSQGSIVKKIIRLAAISGIDVHIISRPETTPTRKHHIQEGSVGAPAAPSDDGGENGHGRDG